MVIEEMQNSANYIAAVLKEDPSKVFSAALAHMKLVTANLCILGEHFSGRGTDHLMRLAMEVVSVFSRLQPQVEAPFSKVVVKNYFRVKDVVASLQLKWLKLRHKALKLQLDKKKYKLSDVLLRTKLRSFMTSLAP